MRMNLLKAKLVEKGITLTQLAEEMGLHIATLYSRVRNPGSFRLWEIRKIQEILGLSLGQLWNIFFRE